MAAMAVTSSSGAGCSHPERGKAVTLGRQVLLISGHSGISDEKRRHEAPPVVGRSGWERGYRHRLQPVFKDRHGPLLIAR